MEPHPLENEPLDGIEDAPAADAERLDPRLAYGLVVLIAAALAGAFAFASGQARAARSPEPSAAPEIHVAADTKDLYAVWQREDVHGAVLVDASAALRFGGVIYGQDVTVTPEYPLEGIDLHEELLRRLARTKALYVASKRGQFRSIHHLMPADTFAVRVDEGRRYNLPGIAEDGKSVRADYQGVPRRIAPDLPEIGEPVVLNVDASYFLEGDAADLLEALRPARLDYRLITLDRATEDTVVTDAARKELDDFAELLKKETR